MLAIYMLFINNSQPSDQVSVIKLTWWSGGLTHTHINWISFHYACARRLGNRLLRRSLLNNVTVDVRYLFTKENCTTWFYVYEVSSRHQMWSSAFPWQPHFSVVAMVSWFLHLDVTLRSGRMNWDIPELFGNRTCTDPDFESCWVFEFLEV